MIILGIPVLNGHATTKESVAHIISSVIDPTSFLLVIIDNGSTPAYRREDFPPDFSIVINRYEVNQGFYGPLKDLIEYPNDTEPIIYALMHNDCFIYEHGWDRRLREAFVNDRDLGIVGFCGSYEVDAAGGRGGGTMCFFRGDRGQPQSAGLRITDLRPAAVLDSLFMAFRSEVAGLLVSQEAPTPAHFYDKIWPMRAIEAGYHVGVLGVEVDHMGGITLVAETQYTNDMVRWCAENGIDDKGNANLAVYLEAERRFLLEYRNNKHLIPGGVSSTYAYRRG
jgi:GT2 family glycosyltransferase